MMQNVNTVLLDLPGSISAYTISNMDMSYTIVLNARLNNERQLAAYNHEINHIKNGDYDKKCSIDYIEQRAHAKK